MRQDLEPLLHDLVAWLAHGPRPHAEVLEAWRTSCPRLPVLEDAVERGLIAYDSTSQPRLMLVATPAGRQFIEQSHAQRATIKV